MKPVTLGCLWLEDASLNFTLKQFAACLLVDGPVNVESSVTNSKSNEAIPSDVSSSTSTSGALYVPDEGNVQCLFDKQKPTELLCYSIAIIIKLNPSPLKTCVLSLAWTSTASKARLSNLEIPVIYYLAVGLSQ